MTYIEREKVIEVIKNFAKGAISDGQKALDPVDDIVLLCQAVDMIPPADIAEEKHAEWIRKDYKPCGHDYICSVCGFGVPIEYKHCPECTAKMYIGRSDT